jgi:hypothetical protein
MMKIGIAKHSQTAGIYINIQCFFLEQHTMLLSAAILNKPTQMILPDLEMTNSFRPNHPKKALSITESRMLF